MSFIREESEFIRLMTAPPMPKPSWPRYVAYVVGIVVLVAILSVTR